MRLDDISDHERVDIDAEAPRECACDALAAEFRARVRVHWVAVIGFLVEGEGMVLVVALAEADAVGCLAACDDDLFDAELTRRLDDVVGAGHVLEEAFVVWDKHVTRIGAEVDDCVWRAGMSLVAVLGHVEEGGQCVEDLTAVAEVCFQSVDVFAGGDVRGRELDEVEVEDGVALREQVGDAVAACFAATAGEDNALAG